MSFVADTAQQIRLNEAAARCEHKALKECLPKGVGIHSAQLSISDRRTVENMFLAQDILALCTTTTLAQGVNLPAHLVVVKSKLSCLPLSQLVRIPCRLVDSSSQIIQIRHHAVLPGQRLHRVRQSHHHANGGQSWPAAVRSRGRRRSHDI